MKNIAVIGSGIGGLASAVILSCRGHKVTVFEKNTHFGGKLNQITANGYRFDTGPSLLTMPFVLERLFNDAGSNLKNELDLVSLNPLCRYFYQDSVQFDSFSDIPSALKALNEFAPSESSAYLKFLSYSADIYNKTTEAFLFNPLDSFDDLKKVNWTDLLKIDALTSVSKRIDKSFKNYHLRTFFKRFSTYNGSSPFLAPATLNVIPFVELCMGGYYVTGGLYKIAEKLKELAEKQGVVFNFGQNIRRIDVHNNKAIGLDGNAYDYIIANSDANETYLQLLPEGTVPQSKIKRIESAEPSCSGFVLLIGIKKKFETLIHHNVLFSSDYEKEFHQIFKNRVMPDDPTIYISNTSFTDPNHAPEGCSNLFVLINAPYLSNSYNWELKTDAYTDFVIKQLENRGLANISRYIEYLSVINPLDFFEKYRSNKGSIYGTSSNSRMAAFMRPRNRSPHVDNLYLAGGSTHPGGGIPLCVLSAYNACDLLERDLK